MTAFWTPRKITACPPDVEVIDVPGQPLPIHNEANSQAKDASALPIPLSAFHPPICYRLARLISGQKPHDSADHSSHFSQGAEGRHAHRCSFPIAQSPMPGPSINFECSQ
ncbi:GM15569 [Drosophila sechellia]|uniref:GM15569 n=1 Tax=Drosophila sechellia TaxID=7238 RepID=B4I8I5_DROSE|nr:GM15569 [Drosophila sechellia]